MPTAPAKSVRLSDGGGAMHVSCGTGVFCFAGDAGGNKVGLHDLSSGESLVHHALSDDAPTCAATAYDAGKAAFGTRKGALYVWDVQFPGVLESFNAIPSGTLDGAPDAISTISWHPRGHALACGGEGGSIAVWDMVLGSLAFRVEEAHEAVTGVAWTGHGRNVVSVGKEGELKVWNSRHGRIDAVIDGTGDVDMWHKGSITALDTIEDMSRVAITGSEEGSVYLSVLKPGDSGCGVFSRLPKHEACVNTVRIAPLGSKAPLRACTGASDGSVRLFDMERKLPMADFKHEDAVVQIEFSADADVLFSAAGKTVVGWDSRAEKEEREEVLFETSAFVNSFCIADAGSAIILGCDDGMLHMFDIRSPGGEMLRQEGVC